MKIQNRFIWFLIAAGLVATMVPLLATQSSMQQNAATVDVKTAGGLRTATFDLPRGKIRVNLPDDMMAGDTISGTVIAEPKGSTEEERQLQRYVCSKRLKRPIEISDLQSEFVPGSQKVTVRPIVIRRMNCLMKTAKGSYRKQLL